MTASNRAAPLALGPRVRVDRLATSDEAAFLGAVAASVALHGSWVSPPKTPEAFQALVARAGPTFEALAIRRREDDALVGFVEVGQIVRDRLRSAYLGYFAFAPLAGQGLMGEGLAAVIAYALGPFGLHRLEANIQPENEASVRLVRRLGFEREGVSKGYLEVDGAWRDHERWAIRAEIFTAPEGITVLAGDAPA